MPLTHKKKEWEEECPPQAGISLVCICLSSSFMPINFFVSSHKTFVRATVSPQRRVFFAVVHGSALHKTSSLLIFRVVLPSCSFFKQFSSHHN